MIKSWQDKVLTIRDLSSQYLLMLTHLELKEKLGDSILVHFGCDVSILPPWAAISLLTSLIISARHSGCTPAIKSLVSIPIQSKYSKFSYKKALRNFKACWIHVLIGIWRGGMPSYVKTTFWHTIKGSATQKNNNKKQPKNGKSRVGIAFLIFFDEQLLENYRPVSTLPIFGKIFEKVIYTRLYDFLSLMDHFIKVSLVLEKVTQPHMH